MNSLPTLFSEILMASDHAGYPLKEALKPFFKEKGLVVHDLGTHQTTPVDYPNYAFTLARELKKKGPETGGILICGSGQGMAIAANRFSHIRAALLWNTESARLARAHNNANVMCLGGRLLTLEQATTLCDVFLTTPFEGERHLNRIQLLTQEGS